MSVVIANTIIALRLMVQSASGSSARYSSQNGGGPLRGGGIPARAIERSPSVRALFLRGHNCIGGPSVFLKLIMQGFQADAENLRRPGLIVGGRLQSLQDELSLCLFHSCAHAQMDGVGIVHGGTHVLAESRRKVLGLNQTALTHDDSPLQRIAQLADVARP